MVIGFFLCENFKQVDRNFPKVHSFSESRHIRLLPIHGAMALHEPDCLTIDCQSKASYGSEVWSVAFSQDGKMIAAGMWGKACLWCSKTGALLAELSIANPRDCLCSVAFSPCNQGKGVVPVLAAGCSDGDIYLWDTPAWKLNAKPDCKLTGHSERVRSVAFTENDRELLVSGSDDCSIRLWDMSTHQQLMQLNGHTRYAASVATFGNTIVSGSWDSTVRIWDMTTGAQLLQMNGHNGYVFSVASMHDDGGPCSKFVASGGCDKCIRLWDMSTGQQIAKLDGHTASVRSVAISSDGRTIASASWDGTVRLWDLSTRRPLHLLKGNKSTEQVYSVALSSDGRRIASGGQDGCVRIWNL